MRLGKVPSCQEANFTSQDAAWAEDKEKLHPFPFVLASLIRGLYEVAGAIIFHFAGLR